jgi:hypothetical protein
MAGEGVEPKEEPKEETTEGPEEPKKRWNEPEDGTVLFRDEQGNPKVIYRRTNDLFFGPSGKGIVIEFGPQPPKEEGK